ncbi:aspartic and glutamic acid-rich protein-like isoform X2 [Penaeus japonicus]|uniref:aspartic and glutamic acid-rich protein-like isoform X2 n=1 Tax=Penaeus japonicus TaxID=27405 RepID=UPI001C716836|nr:aspartic and glutamic acid-rich protein-like isoform X2 [Penaeus japonicus]
MSQPDEIVLTKQILNNFIMKNRPIASKSKKFVIDKLMHQVKKLRQKKAKSDEQKKLFERKADRLVEEAIILKRIRAATVLKFGLLNKKSFASVVSVPDCKIEERALCRLMEQKFLREVVSSFRKKYPHYEREVPLMLQTLGIQKVDNRKKKISILTKWEKLDPYLKKEELNVKIIKDLLGIDINTGILRFCKGKRLEKPGKNKERVREDLKLETQKDENRKRKRDDLEELDLKKFKESSSKGYLSTGREQVMEYDKSKLGNNVSASQQSNASYGQSDGQISESEPDENEEDSADQDESEEDSADQDESEEDSADQDESEEDSADQDEKIDIGSDDKESKDDLPLDKGRDIDQHENVLHQDEDSSVDYYEKVLQDQESNVDLEEESDGDNCENDSEDTVEQSEDDFENSQDKHVVQSNKAGEKLLIKRKISKTCHSDDVLIGNKKNKSLPGTSKKSCNVANPLPAQDVKIQGSGTAEVRILNLSDHDGVIELCDSIKSDDSEEDFFFRDKTKKMEKHRNLFAPHENSEDNIREQSNDNRKGYYDQNNGIIDTSIYFKRNMYRKDGETEGRDQGQESRGYGNEIRGSERSRPPWRNNERRYDDGGRGRPSWRSKDRREDRERGRQSWRDAGKRNNDGGFERRKEKFKFSKDNPNEIPVSWSWDAKRTQITDAKAGSKWANVNGQKDEGICLKSYEQTKTVSDKASGKKDEGLHPSWQAKRRERKQEVSINQFQGQRIVFD